MKKLLLLFFLGLCPVLTVHAQPSPVARAHLARMDRIYGLYREFQTIQRDIAVLEARATELLNPEAQDERSYQERASLAEHFFAAARGKRARLLGMIGGLRSRIYLEQMLMGQAGIARPMRKASEKVDG